MAKRKMVQGNLVKNSVAAYFAAIEIHNKPNIAYRYETMTLLIINAWEAPQYFINVFSTSRQLIITSLVIVD